MDSSGGLGERNKSQELFAKRGDGQRPSSASRASLGSIIKSEPHGLHEHDHDRGHHHVANLQKWFTHKKSDFHRWLEGKEEKTDSEHRLEEFATIIRTYRGLEQEEDTDDGKPWVDKAAFSICISIMIVLNSILIGLEVDLCEERGMDRHIAWIVLEAFFCLLYVTEILLKVWYHRWVWMFRDLWNLIAFIVMLLLLLDFGLGFADIFVRLRLVSLIRVASFVRSTRIIGRFKRLEELRMVVQGLTSALATITWTVLLMLIFIYICAVLLTYQIGHNAEVYSDYRKLSGGWDHEEFFGTVGRSMYTLLQVATLDRWSSQVARHVVNNQAHMAAFFIIFSLLMSFGLLNIVASVIVEHMLGLAQKNVKQNRVRQEKARRMELEMVEDIFKHADETGRGEIDLAGFMEACKDPEVQWEMRQLQLPMGDAAKLFIVIDGDGSRSLSMQEFINGCTQLKGPAQSKDLLAIQAQADTLSSKMTDLENTLDRSEELIQILDDITLRTSRRFHPAIEGCRRKIAHTVGGTKPMVPPKREAPSGARDHELLSLGNRPALPQFPSLLR
jgi:voltage-gated sodium channel